MQTNLVILKNPFNIQEREIKTLDIPETIPLSDFLKTNTPVPLTMEYHASINGRVFEPEEIEAQIVHGGDSVVVCPVLRGGGGSNPLAILAGLALAIFSFGVVAPFVGGLLGGGFVGGIAGSLAAGLTMMVGGQLISNAFAPSISSGNNEVQETSHGWGALQPITQQGAVIPITYGTVRTAGQILNQHVSASLDDSEDTQYLEVMLCGGEGPIASISDIRVNDNPISNFENTSVFTRLGDNSQTVIDGFEKLYSTQTVGVILQPGEESTQVDDDTPVVVASGVPGEWSTVELAGDTVDDIEITLDFPEGLGWVNDDGDIEENTVVVEFGVQHDGAYYSGTISVTSDGKSSKLSPFSKVISLKKYINFVSGTGTWTVKGRWYEADHSPKSLHYRGKVQWSALTAVINSAMTHPGKVLVAVRIKATDQLNGGMPTITWKQTRSHVWVYDGYWGLKDAQNPAWIIYDLCVHARDLDGNITAFGEDPSRIDLAAFKAWAAWNDRTLNNRPALKMNLLVDESKSLWEWVNDIAASARGAVVLKGTKISCIFDAPSTPVQMFTMGNIIAGSFSGEFLPISERANAVEIAYNNEANNYEREQITVYADGFNDTDSRANPVSLQLTGITDFERAYREGFYRLNQNKYLLRTITFTADVDAIACQVGDVILVQHDVPQWGQGGRILSVSGSQLTLDKEVTFNPSYSYVILIRRQNDTRVQYVVSGTGTTDTVTVQGASSSDLAQISPFDIFSLGQVDKTAKPFRVQEMSRSGDLQVTLTCTEYIAELYTEATNIPVIDYTEKTNAITGLQIIATGYYSGSGQWIPEIYAFWNYVGERPASYQVSWKYGDGGIWSGIYNVSEARAQCPVTQRGITYHVRVRALYVSGLPSEWSYATGEALILNPSLPPDPPTGLQATGWFGYASLTWTNPSNIDFAHIEVWEGTEDDLTKAVHIGNTPANSYTRLLPTGGAVWYWVRAVNLTGLKSEFNSLAGTPCIINAESHELYVTQLLRDNPYLAESIERLNERIDPLEIDIAEIKDVDIPQIDVDIAEIKDITLPAINATIREIKDVDIPQIDADITEIKDITLPDIQADISNIKDIAIPDLTGRVTDNQNNIQELLFPALARVSSGVIRLSDETARTRNVFRWAGFEVNEEEGYVVIRALEDLKTETGYQFSDVEQRLDAQAADIDLKANRVYVDELAASIISGIIVAQEWKFNGTLNGWTGQNATLTPQPDGIKYVVTAANPSMTSPDVSINGAINNIIGLQLQQVSGTSAMSIRIQYKTATHGYSDAYVKRVEILGGLNIVRSVQVDMHSLNAGGNDWKDSTITGIRILIDDPVNSQYLIPLVNIGQSSTNELALESLTMRITQAEADIDGANAAIRLKADETTVDALSERLRQAEIDIDALDGAISLKADITSLDTTNQRLQQAEIRLDAVEGTISQEVSDFKLLQEQVNDVSDAAIQNAVNEAQGQDERRKAIAQAKQELHAEITETNEALANYTLDLLAAIDDNTSKIEQEATARATADQAEATARQTLAATVGDNTSAIQTEASTRASQDSALSQRIDTLTATVGDNTSAIQTEASTRATQDTALSRRIDTLTTTVSGNTAAIQTEATSRATEDTALSGRIDTLTATVGDNTSAIQTEASTRATQDTALSQRIDTLQAKTEQNEAAIQAEQIARTDDTSAAAQERTLLQAQINYNSDAAIKNAVNEAQGQDERRRAIAQAKQELYAEIEDTNKAVAGYRLELLGIIDDKEAIYQDKIDVVATDLDAEVTARETLATKVSDNTSAIQSEESTRASQDNALSQRLDTLTATVGDNTSAIQTEASTRASQDSALSQRIDTVQAKTEQNEAAIQTEATARANADQAEATARQTLAGKVADNTAAIQAEASTRATQDTALSQRIDTVQAKAEQNETAIQTEATARANADQAEATARETLAGKVGDNTAAIQAEASTRATQDTALSQRIDTVQAKAEQNETAIQTEATARANADQAEATARQTLATKVAENTLAIQSEATARADADNAMSETVDTLVATVGDSSSGIVQKLNATANTATATAQSVQTLQATVDGHTASIKSTQDAVANTDEQLASKYTLTTDINGYVSGYELFNGGPGMSTFTIAADKFLISRPGVKDPKQLFVYDSAQGSLALRNIVVDWASIKNATINGAIIQNATIDNAKIMNLAVSRDKIAQRTISDTVSAYSNSLALIQYPLINTAVIGGVNVGWAMPIDGLEVHANYEAGAEYYINSSFVFGGMYDFDEYITRGFCFRYVYVYRISGNYFAFDLTNTTIYYRHDSLSAPDRQTHNTFTNETPVTVSFATKFIPPFSGSGTFAVCIGLEGFEGGKWAIFTNPLNAKVKIGPRYINVITLYR